MGEDWRSDIETGDGGPCLLFRSVNCEDGGWGGDEKEEKREWEERE